MSHIRVNPARFNKKVERLKFLVGDNLSPVTDILSRTFNRHIKREYVRILKSEMSPSKELDVLNRGFIIRKGREVIALPVGIAGRKVGTPEGGRFFTANWTPISRAVAEEPVLVDITSPPGILRVGAVNADAVKKRTVFRWQQRDKRGRFKGTGSTEPFGGRWLHVLEHGGQVIVPNFGRVVRNPRISRATQFTGDSAQTVRREGGRWAWYVKPREPGTLLSPEPGIYVAEMKKTVEPISMFSRALFTETRPMMDDFKPRFIRTIVRVGGFLPGRAL